MLEQLGPLVRLPLTVASTAAGLVTGPDPLLDRLSRVADRALALLDAVEQLPRRLDALLRGLEDLPDRLDATMTRLDAVLTRIEAVPDRVDAVLGAADALTQELGVVVRSAADSVQALAPAVAALDVEQVAPLVTDLGILLAGVRGLDPGLLDDATASVRALPALLDGLQVDLLPALVAVEGLVPVVAQLGVNVDRLDGTVAEVGAMLSGIPGAARLLKRGATRPP